MSNVAQSGQCLAKETEVINFLQANHVSVVSRDLFDHPEPASGPFQGLWWALDEIVVASSKGYGKANFDLHFLNFSRVRAPFVSCVFYNLFFLVIFIRKRLKLYIPYWVQIFLFTLRKRIPLEDPDLFGVHKSVGITDVKAFVSVLAEWGCSLSALPRNDGRPVAELITTSLQKSLQSDPIGSEVNVLVISIGSGSNFGHWSEASHSVTKDIV